MRTLRLATITAVLTLLPRAALACAACLSSAYGDRTFNWAYVGLLLMPFAVGAVIGAVFVWSAGYRLHLPRIRHLRNVIPKETT